MGQDLTIVAEYYDGWWRLAEPLQSTGLSDAIPSYLFEIEGYMERYGHLLSESSPVVTHEPVNLWGGRDTDLQAQLMDATKNHGLPGDCSDELREYVESHFLQWGYGLGWMIERQLTPQIKNRINLSKYRSLGTLRVIYWFS